MLSSLVTTKLYFPPARSPLVSRPRLVECLQNGLKGRLTLVSAPAGYGKTTLMSEWRAGVGCDYTTAWLSLDGDDNDSTRFLTYIIAALASQKLGFGETTLALLQSSPPLSTQVILTSLINELGAFDKTFSLILDDYHVITNHPIHEAVTYLLDHLPSQMHLVILTRADPPLPLSRLRGRNQLIEIRAADLCFTVEEAAAFLNQVMGLALSLDQVGALEQRTEGWVAGLQLAALSMRGRVDVQDFVSAFTGSHHYIVDYLADEVLNSQTEPVQEFLLRTSILDRLTAPLCDALTDRSDGQTTLEKLEHTNLFLISLDNERCWYRYHPLFADMLRNHLQQKYPDMLGELHLRAAVWCEQNQFIEQAIEHTFAVEEYARVVQLFKKYLYQWLFPRRSSLIWRWFESFPEYVMRENPWLGVAYARALWRRGNREAAELPLNYAQQALTNMISNGQLPGDDPEYLFLSADLLSLQGLFCASKGELERAIELANQALAIAPETAYTIQSIAYIDLYLAYIDQGEIDRAIEACTQAMPLAKAGGESGAITNVYQDLGSMLTIQGHLKQAAQIYRDGLQYVENKFHSHLPDHSILLIQFAEIYYEWNDLYEAELLANRALRLSEPAYWQVMIYGRIFLARLQRVKRNWPEAISLMEKAETLLQHLKGAYFEKELRAYLARLQTELGKLDEPAQWVQSVTLDLGNRLSYPQHVIAFQLAYVLSALDREDELLTLLSQIEPLTAAQGCIGWQIQALVLQATAWLRKANPSNALTCLEKALFLAEPEGYVRIFLDEGESMRLLIADYRLQVEKRMQSTNRENLERMKAYIMKLLMAFPLPDFATSKLAVHDLQSTILEPLSEREMEVLRLVAEGMSNGQIADALVIATGTVKKHINNIFGKLGVQSRTQCVARARDLNLL